jgi:hypothetical protein
MSRTLTTRPIDHLKRRVLPCGALFDSRLAAATADQRAAE